MEAQDRKVKDWISQIRLGRLALPRFQRHEAWYPYIINDFLTSTIRGLPVGVSLILEVGAKPQFHYRHFEGISKNGEPVKELLLDGQQRLTALWKSLTDGYKNRIYMLDLDTQEEKEVTVISVTRWIPKQNKVLYPLWVDDPKECWQRKKIPFRLFNPDNEKEYSEWTKQASNGNTEEQLFLVELIRTYREKIAYFNIPYLNLPSETSPDVAIDVFVKLNTSYVKLTAFDIIVAQVEEATGQSLHDRVSMLCNQVPEISDYINVSDYVLAVAALLQDKLPNQRGFFGLDLYKMIDHWEKIVKGTNSLVSFLEEENVFDGERLPTETILAPVAAILADDFKNPDKKGNINNLLKKYLWRAFFTERYDRSVPTRIIQDYRAIKKYVDNKIEQSVIPIFDEKQNPLPNEDLIEQASWPKKKDRLARAILLLSLRKGARDFADSSSIDRRNVKHREYHHLFPDAYLKKLRYQALALMYFTCD